MSKYIDLADRIASELGGYAEEHRVTLAYLDRYPGLVPGRTITESELGEVTRTHESIRDLVNLLDITIVPDPEPTEAERLADDLARWTGDIETCVGLGLASWLADKGWTKAPGGENDE